MVTALLWLAVLIAVVAGIAVLGRTRRMSEEEYEERRGKGAALGNAVQALHAILDPERGRARAAREERLAEEDPAGDPPEPEDPRAGSG